jgi:hypothetical protein
VGGLKKKGEKYDGETLAKISWGYSMLRSCSAAFCVEGGKLKRRSGTWRREGGGGGERERMELDKQEGGRGITGVISCVAKARATSLNAGEYNNASLLNQHTLWVIFDRTTVSEDRGKEKNRVTFLL